MCITLFCAWNQDPLKAPGEATSELGDWIWRAKKMWSQVVKLSDGPSDALLRGRDCGLWTGHPSQFLRKLPWFLVCWCWGTWGVWPLNPPPLTQAVGQRFLRSLTSVLLLTRLPRPPPTGQFCRSKGLHHHSLYQMPPLLTCYHLCWE